MKLLTCFPLTDGQITQLRQAVPNWEIAHANQENVTDFVHDCDVFCGHGRHHQIDWDRVISAGKLKWIQSSAAGMDHCLVPAVIDSSVQVSGCSGLFRDSVAEQSMALLLGLLRSLPLFFESQQNRQFIRRPTDDLHGKTVGIVGFGGNGQRIAEVLKPYGVRLLATDLFPTEWKNLGVDSIVDTLLPAAELSHLLSHSDIVILTAPLNRDTERMLGDREIQTMKPGSYLVNVGRGKLLDEPALVQALQSGHLKGAGLDVTWTEPPPPESLLWQQPNLLLTPHVGAQAANRYQKVVDLLIENLGRFQSDVPLKNRVDKGLGFSRPSARD